MERVRSDASGAPVTAKLKTLLAIAAAVQQGGLSVTADLVARARAADATDLEIHDTVLIAAAFCMFNRYVDGLATIAPDDPALYAAGAQRHSKDGTRPPPGEPSRQNKPQLPTPQLRVLWLGPPARAVMSQKRGSAETIGSQVSESTRGGTLSRRAGDSSAHGAAASTSAGQ